jgi:hypothetical protein
MNEWASNPQNFYRINYSWSWNAIGLSYMGPYMQIFEEKKEKIMSV